MAALEKTDPQNHDRFLMAEISVAGNDGAHQIRVRNLSAGGMMGEGSVAVDSGSQVEVAMPNFGSVPGRVAWVQGDRFGVAFADEIDPEIVFGSNAVASDAGDPERAGVASDRRSQTRLR